MWRCSRTSRGGIVKRSADDKVVTGEINGGLVVPLYVVVLALFGGAISMTRRVPEYQRRALDSHDVLTNADTAGALLSAQTPPPQQQAHVYYDEMAAQQIISKSERTGTTCLERSA